MTKADYPWRAPNRLYFLRV